MDVREYTASHGGACEDLVELIVVAHGKLDLLLLGLFGEKDRVDVREHTASRDGDTSEELVELLVVAHGKVQVTRDDASLLVIAGRVASELQHLGAEVLEHGGEVHGRAGADARGVLALLEEAVHTADGELETRLHRASKNLFCDKQLPFVDRERSERRRTSIGATTGGAHACLAGHVLSNMLYKIIFRCFYTLPFDR